jgi:hypothetical protein
MKNATIGTAAGVVTEGTLAFVVVSGDISP